MDGAAPERSRALLAALIGTTAALKVALAWAYPGFLSGDDLEIVLTAARSAVHLDYSPWPIRSLFHPLVLVLPVMKTGVAAGLESPRWLTLLAALPTAAFSTLSVWLAYRVARALGAAEGTALAAAFLCATAGIPFAHGATPYPRPISAALLLAAFFLLVRRAAGWRDAAAAGVLTAAALAVRWSEGLAVVPLFVVALATDSGRTGRRAVALLVGFAAGVLVFVGAFDDLTWGAPFSSLKAFVEFLGQPHEAFTPRPPWWYAGMLLQWAGPVVVVLCAAGVSDRRARWPLFVAVAIVALLSPTPIKSLRYTIAASGFLAVAAAFGWERLRRGGRLGRAVAAACLVAAVPLGAERTLHLLRTKTQSAVEAAQFLATRRPAIRTVALEQPWAYGEALYLGSRVRIVDITSSGRLEPEAVIRAAAGCDALGAYRADVGEELERALVRSGLRRTAQFQEGISPGVVIYERSEGRTR